MKNNQKKRKHQQENLFTLQFLLPPAQESRLRDWAQQHHYATWPNWGGHITLVNIFESQIPNSLLVDILSQKCRQTPAFRIFFNRLILEHHRIHQGLYTVYLTYPRHSPEESYRLRNFHEEIISLLQPHVDFKQKELETSRYRQHLSLTWGVPKEQALALYEEALRWKLELWCVVDSLTLLKVNSRNKKQWEMNIYRELPLDTSSGT